jgi:hypothetical protein
LDNGLCNVGGDACTPGFWKNNVRKGMTHWILAGYDPKDDFDATFGVDLFERDITLYEALRAKGGHLNKLARHATAALLNASHGDVGYPMTLFEVMDAVLTVGVDYALLEETADMFAGHNEDGACPLSNAGPRR